MHFIFNLTMNLNVWISILDTLTCVLNLVASPNIFAKFNHILYCFDIFHLPLDYIHVKVHWARSRGSVQSLVEFLTKHVNKVDIYLLNRPQICHECEHKYFQIVLSRNQGIYALTDWLEEAVLYTSAHKTWRRSWRGSLLWRIIWFDS